jgi:hypothetical protein
MSEKSNSLIGLGYTIEPQSDAKDENGLEIVAVAYKPIYIKRTKRGKLKAYKAVNDKVETTVEGLYNFELQGNDLVGKRLEAKPAATPAVTTAPVSA